LRGPFCGESTWSAGLSKFNRVAIFDITSLKSNLKNLCDLIEELCVNSVRGLKVLFMCCLDFYCFCFPLFLVYFSTYFYMDWLSGTTKKKNLIACLKLWWSSPDASYCIFWIKGYNLLTSVPFGDISKLAFNEFNNESCIKWLVVVLQLVQWDSYIV